MSLSSVPNVPRLGSVSEAASILGLSDWSTYEFLKRNKHLRVQLGRKVRVNLDSLAAYISAGGDCASRAE